MRWLLAGGVALAGPVNWFCLEEEPPAARGDTIPALVGDVRPVGLVPVSHRPGRPAAWGVDYVDLTGRRWAWGAVLEALDAGGQGEAVREMGALEEARIVVQESARWARKSPLERVVEERRLREAQEALLAPALCAVNTGVTAPRPPLVWEADLSPGAVQMEALRATGLDARLAAVELPTATEPEHLVAEVAGLSVEVFTVPWAVDATVGWRLESGAFDDGQASWGRTHLAEHLLFRHPGFQAWVGEVGGALNGSTSPGWMDLTTTVPGPDLAELLERDVARVRRHRFSDAEHAIELEIVTREEDYSSNLRGSGHLVENATLWSLAWGGAPPDPLPRGSAAEVRAWMDQTLRPDRLHLIVASPYASDAVVALIKSAVGQGWRGGPASTRARWPELAGPVELPAFRAGDTHVRAWRPPPPCADCREAAVETLGLRWLQAHGGERLGAMLTERAELALREEIRATKGRAYRDGSTPIFYVRYLVFTVWTLGEEVVLSAELSTSDDRGRHDYGSELAHLADLLRNQEVVSPADLEGLLGWHAWRNRVATYSTAELVEHHLDVSATRVDALDDAYLAEVSAEEVQAWLAALFASEPSRTGRRR
jgi:hypothetical protein